MRFDASSVSLDKDHLKGILAMPVAESLSTAARKGNSKRLNRTFEGRLEDILVDINEALWQEAS